MRSTGCQARQNLVLSSFISCTRSWSWAYAGFSRMRPTARRSTSARLLAMPAVISVPRAWPEVRGHPLYGAGVKGQIPGAST
jgi:hypothetical protein